MKRLLALAAALLLLSIPLSATAQYDTMGAPEPLQGYLLKDDGTRLRVYVTPSAKGNIAGYIEPGSGADVSVLQVEGEWCFISFPTGSGFGYGYLPLSCFTLQTTSTPPPAPEAVSLESAPAWILNAAEGYRVNLREEPSVHSSSLGKYYTGTPLTLTGKTENGFAQVLTAGQLLGWLDARYLTTDSLTFVPELPVVTIDNPGSGANLRAKPGTDSDRLGWFRHGMQVTVLGVRADGWYHVMINEQVGYISGSLLSGKFPYEYGSDSDDPMRDSQLAKHDALFYLNTRTAGGTVHLRKEASRAAKSMGVFYTGTPVTLISYTRTGWAYVQIGHTQGYMDADYLSPAKPATSGVQRVIRNSKASGLNLRALPSTGSEILAFLENYSQLTLLGELSDNWCYVLVNNELGYMMGTYLYPVH